MLMRVAASLPPCFDLIKAVLSVHPERELDVLLQACPRVLAASYADLVWLDPREVRESFVAQIGPEVEVYACFTPGDQKLPNSNWQWSCMPSWPEPSPFGGVAASGISIISRRSCR